MLAVPFSLRTGQITGATLPIRDGIAVGLNDVPLMAVSATGTMFVRTGGNMAATEVYELAWVDRQGRETSVDSSFRFRLTVQGENRGWALAPGGRRLAIGLNTDAGDNIWVKQLPNGPLSRVTYDSAPEHRPRWLPDGRSIAFIRYEGTGRLFQRSADGLGVDSMVADLTGGQFGVFEGAWSPDGNWLVIRVGGTMSVSGGRDIYIQRRAQDSVPRPLIASEQFDEAAIAISPDGRWIAYESNETGRTEVYIRPFPDAMGGKWQVSADGGRAPLWAKNSRELFYVNAARDMMVKSVTPGPIPALGLPRRLFHLRPELYLVDLERYTPFDISDDGQRFIMARRVAATAGQSAPLQVTENWFTELKRIVRPR
jgi:Tol biopolymer transport system component